MYAKYGQDDYIASLYEDMEAGHYVITFHRGRMPAFDSKVFDILEEAKSWAKSELGITHWRGFDGQFVARPD